MYSNSFGSKLWKYWNCQKHIDAVCFDNFSMYCKCHWQMNWTCVLRRMKEIKKTKLHYCQFDNCLKHFTSNVKLKNHINAIHKRLRYYCKECPKDFGYSHTLKNHQKVLIKKFVNFVINANIHILIMVRKVCITVKVICVTSVKIHSQDIVIWKTIYAGKIAFNVEYWWSLCMNWRNIFQNMTIWHSEIFLTVAVMKSIQRIFFNYGVIRC